MDINVCPVTSLSMYRHWSFLRQRCRDFRPLLLLLSFLQSNGRALEEAQEKEERTADYTAELPSYPREASMM